jgi:hypothetical protein
MSTFTVLVVGPDNYQELVRTLEPFDEHIEFPPYIKFTREDKKAERKRLLKHYKQQLKLHPMDIGIENKIVELGFNDEDYFKKQTQYYNSSQLTDQGEPISTYNPNTRWSRWDYKKELPMRHKDCVAACRKRDVDWAYAKQIRLRNAWTRWPKIKNADVTDFMSGNVWGKWQGETKEQYFERQEYFLTNAFILHGKWHERGKIGWWSEPHPTMDRQKWIDKYQKMLTEVKPNTVLTTVECSI